MASRTSTDPLEILLEMGVDLDNLSEEEDYLSALIDLLHRILKLKGVGSTYSYTQRSKEIRKVRQKRKSADNHKARKTKISAC